MSSTHLRLTPEPLSSLILGEESGKDQPKPAELPQSQGNAQEPLASQSRPASPSLVPELPAAP